MALLACNDKESAYDIAIPLEKGIALALTRDGELRWHLDQVSSAQCLAQITRADSGFYVIVVAQDNEVKVSDTPLFGLRVLRHTDYIEIGQDLLTFYDWVRQEIGSNSPYLNTPCRFCALPFEIGEQVVFCPKCDTLMHETCWSSRREVGEGCIVPNCGYMPPEDKPYIPVAQRPEQSNAGR